MLIDFHTHCFPDKIAKRAISVLEGNVIKMQGRNYPARTDGSLGELLKTMKEDGVDFSVVLPIATTPSQSGSINRFAKEINGKNGIISFGSVHPLQEDWEEVLEQIKDDGLLGIKLHPEYQGVYVTSAEVRRILKKCEELDLYTVFHAGADIGMPEPIHCMPECLNHMLDYVSGDKIIAAHMGGWNKWDDVEKYLVGTPIKFDTSYIKGFLDKERFRQIVRNHGVDKIVFGTDHPWQRANEALEFIDSAGFTEDELDRIYFKNAAEILGINLKD